MNAPALHFLCKQCGAPAPRFYVEAPSGTVLLCAGHASAARAMGAPVVDRLGAPAIAARAAPSPGPGPAAGPAPGTFRQQASEVAEGVWGLIVRGEIPEGVRRALKACERCEGKRRIAWAGHEVPCPVCCDEQGRVR